MPKPNQPRKKVAKAPKGTHYNSRSGDSHYFTRLQKTPEGRALHRSWMKKPKGPNVGRPWGTHDGHTAKDMKPIRDKAKQEAKKVVKIMSENPEYNIDDKYSKEALETSVEIMRTAPASARDRLTAARLILDFTRSKPAAKSEVTIGKAEAFLSSLLDSEEEEEQTDANPEASEGDTQTSV